MAQNNKHACIKNARWTFPAAEISAQHMMVRTTGITDQKASYQLEFLKITLKKYIKNVASIWQTSTLKINDYSEKKFQVNSIE